MLNSLVNKRIIRKHTGLVYSHIAKRYSIGGGKENLSSDYIIIGGGSAGCVLANRLSEEKDNSVLLIEAGLPDKGLYDSWKIHMPAALTYNIGSEKYNWNYLTEPQSALGGRRLIWPRGKVLGGSSSLNAMCYVRGHALDYDRWAEEAPGWEYKNVLPYFKKSQTHELGENDYRGGSGPLYVTRSNTKNKLFENFVNAGIESGYPYTEDQNGYQQEGFGPMDMTIYKGARWSASFAYLDTKVTSRPNLTIKCNHFVEKIIFDNNGKTAKGVAVRDENGTLRTIYANKEVILSGGAINSPQLLMLSGVGNSEELAKIGINPVHHLPEVGQNLQDHLEVYLQYECRNPISLTEYANWWPPFKKAQAGMEWFLFKRGVCAVNHFETGSFIRSKKGLKHPDIQHHFFPGAVEQQKDIVKVHAYQVHCGTMRPKSRGYLKLKSNNPYEKPLIEPNLLSEKEDFDDLCEGIKLTVEILNAKAFEADRHRSINFKESMIQNQRELEEWTKKHVESAYHCSCTCAMGKVTESDGRVKGLKNLRVCDASIMPYVVSGNTNGPTIMLAEKISDMIKGKTLPPSDAKYYIPSNWETSQR